MAEVARRAHDEGAQVLLGRCDEQILAPYARWIEALRTLVANVHEQVLTEHVDRHGGAISRLVPANIEDPGRRRPPPATIPTPSGSGCSRR